MAVEFVSGKEHYDKVIAQVASMTLQRGLKTFFQNTVIGKTTVFFNIITHIVSVKVRELGMEQQ